MRLGDDDYANVLAEGRQSKLDSWSYMAFRSTTQRGLEERERGAAVFQPVARRPRART
jgi:hypothetical protein